MSITFLAALLALAAGPDLAMPIPRVAGAQIRPLTTGAGELLREAERRSTIVATLLRSLEATDAIVYVTDAMPVSRQGAKSHLVFLSLDSTVRYLLVWLDGTRLSPTERIVALGHELFHALEVASAPEVRDGKSFVRLFRRIGWETSKDRFETTGAQDMSECVQRSLVYSSSAEPPPDFATSSCFTRSTLNFEALAMILSRVSSKSNEVAVEKRV